MSKALDAFYRFLDEPIFPWARVTLAVLTIGFRHKLGRLCSPDAFHA